MKDFKCNKDDFYHRSNSDYIPENEADDLIYLSEEYNDEIGFFELESVIDAYKSVLAKCATLAKIFHNMQMQAKGISKGNDKLSKDVTSSKKKRKRLEKRVKNLENELSILRKENDKSVLEHKNLVKDTTIIKDTNHLNLLN
ncbi:hypothetical protein LR48_Vigan08g018800 [Vigna angularis]|uniref:Uncharacterized protein n=1 Tax=Phaseolus angularis TaxID=3914 RepID=A0A0L9V324_PHAAN|nr:hypothetical protein LR48_Vigan08g018800 [Vigna angularis]